MTTTEPFYAVIPAGGSGTRLWPLSRGSRPKFLLPLPGPRTMIQETVERLAPLAGPSHTYAVTGAAHAAELARQTPELPADQILVEPLARGSGPAIGLGVAIAARHNPEAVCGSFAADHLVTDQDAFLEAVRAAIAVARAGHLVTVGITPRYPETGYGYIRAGDPLDLPGSTRAYRVAEFKEKPDIETATRYVREGSYLWNASMFVWQAGTLMAEIERFLPELHDALQRIVDAWDTPRREETLARIWPTVTDVSIDHGILERSDRVAVVPGTFGWSDLGDWHGVGTILQNGDDSNVVIGCEAVTSHARNAVIVGNQRTVAVVGIDNIVVVDTPDALLVCERSRAQDVRGIVAQLRQRGALDLI